MLIDQAKFLKSEMRKLDRSRYSVLWITSPLFAISEIKSLYKLFEYVRILCDNKMLMF